MRRNVVFSIIVSSFVSSAVTTLVLLAVLPGIVNAEATRLIGTSLSVVGAGGAPAVTADVGDPGGGILRVVGSDGKTVRLSLNSSGQSVDGGIAPNAGLNVYDIYGQEVVRVGATRP